MVLLVQLSLMVNAQICGKSSDPDPLNSFTCEGEGSLTTRSKVNEFIGESSATVGLRNKNITCITTGVFQLGFSQFKYVDFVGNQIKRVQLGVFRGLSAATKMYLDDNLIETIDAGGFYDLYSLKLLYLSGNRLTSIKKGMFDGLTKLEELDLAGNLIESIDLEAFQGLEKLRVLELGSNAIKVLQAGLFDNLNSMYKLYLYDTSLTIKRDAIRNLPSLQYVITWTANLDFEDGSLYNLPELIEFGPLPVTKIDSAVFSQENIKNSNTLTIIVEEYTISSPNADLCSQNDKCVVTA